MQDVIGALGGFRGVRADLLVALKKGQPLTAQELGQRFGLTANALRRHLKALEEDGLVSFARTVRGVGAPSYTYSLTVAGESLFPRSYVSVLTSALDALRAQRGDAAVMGVLEAEWLELANEAAPVVAALPLSERAALVAELMTAKGYMAEWIAPASDDAGLATLRIHNCAVRELAERFPEACDVEAKFVERLLGVPLVRGRHRRDGCGRCEYSVVPAAVACTDTMVWEQEQA